MGLGRVIAGWVSAVVLTAVIGLALQAGGGAVPVGRLDPSTVPGLEWRIGLDGVPEISVIDPQARPKTPSRLSMASLVGPGLGKPTLRYLDRLGLPLRIGPFEFLGQYGWKNGLLWIAAGTRSVSLMMGIDTNGRVAELLYAPAEMRLGEPGLLANGDFIVVSSFTGWSTTPRPSEVWLLPQNSALMPTRLPGEEFLISPNGERVLLFSHPGPTLLFDVRARTTTPLREVPVSQWPVWEFEVRVDWLADSGTLLITRETGRRFQAALVDVLEDRVVRVWKREDASAIAEVSPDGRYVAVTWVLPEDELWSEHSAYPDPIGREIEFFDSKSGRSWRFRSEDDPRLPHALLWSGDGAWLVTGEPVDDPHEGHPPPSGPYRVWWAGYDGTQRSFQVVDRLLGFKVVLAMSPSGREVAITVWRGQWWDLLLLDPTTGRVMRWEDTQFVSWPLDDRILAWLSRTSASPETQSITVVTREGVRLGQVDYRTAFSPDFRTLAVVSSGPNVDTGHTRLRYLVVTPNRLR